MAGGDDGTLARLMARLLTGTGPFVEEDVDAAINQRLATLMDAETDERRSGA